MLPLMGPKYKKNDYVWDVYGMSFDDTNLEATKSLQLLAILGAPAGT
jgi:hypothetical protein